MPGVTAVFLQLRNPIKSPMKLHVYICLLNTIVMLAVITVIRDAGAINIHTALKLENK
jgi:hypothetical protein